SSISMPPPPPVSPPFPYTTLFRSGQIHPMTAKEYRINETFAFELNLDEIIALPKHQGRYEAISRYPAVSRDLAILVGRDVPASRDRKSTRLNSSHVSISYAVFCLK